MYTVKTNEEDSIGQDEIFILANMGIKRHAISKHDSLGAPVDLLIEPFVISKYGYEEQGVTGEKLLFNQLPT